MRNFIKEFFTFESSSRASKASGKQNFSSTQANPQVQKKKKKQQYKSHINEIVSQRRKVLNPMMSISYHPQPLKLHSGKGQYFFQEDGKKVLDCINNVSHIGHCHPYYVKKMQQQTNKLLTNSRFLYDEMLQATNKLLEKLPSELSVITFTNSGSQANDLALQMAQIHTKKRGIICLDGAYHGVTKSCFQISPYKWNDQTTQAPYVSVAQSPCAYRGFLSGKKEPQKQYAKYLQQQIINQETGAFICQYMQSCAGQIIPSKTHYQQVYKVLKKRNIVCIGDQVQTGFGRLGKSFWAFQYYGVIPDIVTVGKAMGNGFPVSAVITTKQISESYKKRGIEYFSTFGGNPLAVTAVSCVLDVIKDQKLQQNANITGKYLNERLQELLKFSFVGDIRGMGLFQGIDLVKDKESKEENGELAKEIILKMREKGILVSRDGKKGNVLKLKPPIVFNTKNVDQLMKALFVLFEQIQHA